MESIRTRALATLSQQRAKDAEQRESALRERRAMLDASVIRALDILEVRPSEQARLADAASADEDNATARVVTDEGLEFLIAATFPHTPQRISLVQHCPICRREVLVGTPNLYTLGLALEAAPIDLASDCDAGNGEGHTAAERDAWLEALERERGTEEPETPSAPDAAPITDPLATRLYRDPNDEEWLRALAAWLSVPEQREYQDALLTATRRLIHLNTAPF